MKVRFLLDENLSPRLKVALLRLNPVIDVVRVGEPGAPQLGTPALNTKGSGERFARTFCFDQAGG